MSFEPRVSRAGYLSVSFISLSFLTLFIRTTFLFWDFVLYSGLEWRFLLFLTLYNTRLLYVAACTRF